MLAFVKFLVKIFLISIGTICSQINITEEIVENGSYYLLFVKDNQLSLGKSVQEALSETIIKKLNLDSKGMGNGSQTIVRLMLRRLQRRIQNGKLKKHWCRSVIAITFVQRS